MNPNDIEIFVEKNASEFSKLDTTLQGLLLTALGSSDAKDLSTERAWQTLFKEIDFPILTDLNADLDGRNLNDLQKTIVLLAHRSEERYFDLSQRERIPRKWASIYAFPTLATIPRWLGIQTSGLMEEVVDFQHEGSVLRIPMWRALQLAEEEEPKIFFESIPFKKKMELLFELLAFENLYDEAMYDISSGMFMGKKAMAQIDASTLDVAVAHLDRLAENDVDTYQEWDLFLTCVTRAGHEIKPAWEAYIPEWRVIHYLSFLADDRKEEAIKAAVPKFMFSTRTVNHAIQLLEAHPCQVLVDAIAEHYKDAQIPDRVVLTRAMAALSEESEFHPSFQELYDQLPKIEELFVRTKTDASTPDTFKDNRYRQLEIAMNKWDGNERELTSRFSDEEDLCPQDNVNEILGFCNKKGKGIVDVYLIGCDGTIFESGTTNVFGSIIQDKIKMRKRKLKDALQSALYHKPRWIA